MALVVLPPPQSSLHNLPNYPTPPSQPLRISMDSQNPSRPSLPSISSLIESVADQNESRNTSSPQSDRPRRISSSSATFSRSPDRRTNASPRTLPPPTPPLPPASSFDFPRNASPVSAPTRSPLYHAKPSPSSTSPELYAQRNMTYPPIPDPTSSSSYLPLPDPHQWPAPRSVPESSMHETLNPTPLPSIEPMEDGHFQGLPAQKSLPTDFPPPVHGQPGSVPGPGPASDQLLGAPPAWQHHHYYPPANPPSYPHPQDRYICLTCNKPFSRPSSLKIHNYSHTGEKPYKCKHAGCGKHFSVRSNMKRHEKGCHGGAGERSSSSGASPKAA